jgi:hypothetical protein
MLKEINLTSLMASLLILLNAITTVFRAILLAVCQKVRCSPFSISICNLIRSTDLFPAPNILHLDEITSNTLSDILRRPVEIIGTLDLGDGKMSFIRKLSYIE